MWKPAAGEPTATGAAAGAAAALTCILQQQHRTHSVAHSQRTAHSTAGSRMRDAAQHRVATPRTVP